MHLVLLWIVRRVKLVSIKSMAITVSIVEDNEQLRTTLARVISRAEGFSCISHYGDAESALEALPKEAPEVVLMDINLPKMNGVECVRRLKQVSSATMRFMSVFGGRAEPIRGRADTPSMREPCGAVGAEPPDRRAWAAIRRGVATYRARIPTFRGPNARICRGTSPIPFTSHPAAASGHVAPSPVHRAPMRYPRSSLKTAGGSPARGFSFGKQEDLTTVHF